AAATAATLSVMWLCAFKQAGNYILPYSYSALHGCALGLAALALAVKAVGSRQKAAGSSEKAEDKDLISDESDSSHQAQCKQLSAAYWLAAAGALAGLATLAKTEMGLAALTAGVMAAALAGYPNKRRAAALTLAFAMPAMLVVVAAYGIIVARVGWQTLSQDSFLFLRNLSPELIYFNKRVSGFDQPLQSFIQMIAATARLAAIAIIIATLSLIITRNGKDRASGKIALAEAGITDAGRITYLQLWALFALSLIVFFLIPLADGMSWDKGPYLAMPLLLAALLIGALVVYQKQVSKRGEANEKIITLIVVGAYALASLARVILRVRSGGAYSSYLLPASVILFTYGWARLFAGLFRDGRTRRVARNIAIGLILADVVATAGLLAYRYRAKNTYPIVTERGTIIAVPDLGQAVEEAMDFIKKETAPGEAVAVMPEGTSLNFFTERPNPIREEITTPGYLDAAGEERAIRQLEQSNTRLILVTNRATPEFGPAVFGRDYCERLMAWIDANFEPVAIFGPDKSDDLQIGDKTFFIRAYRKKQKVLTLLRPEF
ncbi:MAG TPA: hypothetical protein VNN73_00600, partial [Blastocatellia bacterium]|nr:hypothetical protein [Blastocatellia bacterium]